MLNPTEGDLAAVPSALSEMMIEDTYLTKCHWRSSGLKSHRANVDDAKYLFRYCYPQEDSDYSSSTGAAVWTKRDEDDNEDFSVRILHIYQTTKRTSSGSSTNPSKKKRTKTRSSSIVPVVTRSSSTVPNLPNATDNDIHPLMKGELITTPTRTYEDYSDVTLGAHGNCFGPQCFDETPRVSMSPGTNLRSFAIKVDCLTKDVLASDQEHQPFMVHLLREQLEALSGAVDTKK